MAPAPRCSVTQFIEPNWFARTLTRVSGAFLTFASISKERRTSSVPSSSAISLAMRAVKFASGTSTTPSPVCFLKTSPLGVSR